MTFLELLAGLTLKRSLPFKLLSRSSTKMSPGLTWACAVGMGTIMLKAEAISIRIKIDFWFLIPAFLLALHALHATAPRLAIGC